MTGPRQVRDPWVPAKARLLDAIIQFDLSRSLEGVFVRGDFPVDPDGVTAFVCNHTGRWDGFAIRRERFRRESTGRHYTVMLSREMRRHWIFRQSGMIGIEPGSVSSVRRMVECIATFVKPGDTIALFPQGEIFPGDKTPLGFRALVRVLRHVDAPVRMVPTALATEMLHKAKPSVFVSFGHYVCIDQLGDVRRDTQLLVKREVENLRRDLNLLGERAIHDYEHA